LPRREETHGQIGGVGEPFPQICRRAHTPKDGHVAVEDGVGLDRGPL